jgi:ankyrin repeat protein
LAAGADYHVSNQAGNTASMLVCCQRTPAVAVLQALLNAGAHHSAPNQDGNTPLTLVCRQEKPVVTVAQALLDAGADANQPNRKCQLPLILACRRGLSQLLVEALLKACHTAECFWSRYQPYSVRLADEETAIHPIRLHRRGLEWDDEQSLDQSILILSSMKWVCIYR